MNFFFDLFVENLIIVVNMTKILFLIVIYGFNFSNDLFSMLIIRFFLVLLECFGIVFCGYIVGRVNVIILI